ncbi:MAG TPA: DUF4010 domain-containing protein [Solirubrobacteraceae bacterium]
MPVVAALCIGLLIGIERERRKQRAADRGGPGLRTFGMVGALGALLAGLDEPGTVAVGLAFVAAAGLMHAFVAERTGMTTPVALVVVYALGVLADRDLELAAALGVGVTLLLVERTRLHTLVRESLSERELLDGLLLAACALIVLPLLPDEGIGPGNALNPVTVWRLAVAIMLINALGYVALRTLGAGRGLPLVGFIGGFVSSTATIGAMGARAQREPAYASPALAAALAANVATIVFTAIVLAITDVGVLGATGAALALGGVAALAVGGLAARRVSRPVGDDETTRGRAFDIKAPLILALTISAVLTVANLLQDVLGPSGALIAVAVGGFADAQSAAVSAASLAAAGRLETGTAALGVVIALTTNSLTKCAFATAFRQRRAILHVWGGIAAISASAWVGYGIQAALR